MKSTFKLIVNFLCLALIFTACSKPDLLTFQNDYHKSVEYGDYDRALNKALEALDVFEKAYGTDHVDVAVILGDIGHLYLQQKNIMEAKSYLLSSVAIMQKHHGQFHPDLSGPLGTLAYIYTDEGKTQKAFESSKQAFAIVKMAFEKNDREYTDALLSYTQTLYVVEQYEEARELNLELLTITGEMYGTDGLPYSKVLSSLGNVYRRLQEYDAAIDYYKRAIAIRKTIDDPLELDLVIYDLSGLGNAYLGQKKYKEALETFERLEENVALILGPEKSEMVFAYEGMARIYFAQGQYDKSYDLYMKSLTEIRRAMSVHHPNAPTVLNGLAQIMLKRGDTGKANSYANKAYDIIEMQKGPDHPWLKRQQAFIDSIV